MLLECGEEEWSREEVFFRGGGAGQFSSFFFLLFGGAGSWFADSALARRRNERLSVLFLSPINQTGAIVAAHVPLAQCCCD